LFPISAVVQLLYINAASARCHVFERCTPARVWFCPFSRLNKLYLILILRLFCS